MAGVPETLLAAPPAAATEDADLALAGGESDLDLWGGWPDDELAPPETVPDNWPARLTGAHGARVSDG